MKINRLQSLYRLWTPERPESQRIGNLLEIGKLDPIFTDRFKGLRAKFEHRSEMMKCRLIGFTSSIPGEGKTLACAHLAANLALTGRYRVLLVDTDVRKADLTHGLGIPRRPGLMDYLGGGAPLKDIVRDSRVPGLKVIPAGSEVNSPTDLLSGDAFRRFVRDIRESHDYVLLDTPPIIPVADTVTMREQLDVFVFLFRASFTPVPIFEQALSEFGREKILGVVVNGVEPHKKKYIDRYYSYYHNKTPTKENQPA